MPKFGGDATVERITQYPGGSALNVAVGMGEIFGTCVNWVSRVRILRKIVNLFNTRLLFRVWVHVCGAVLFKIALRDLQCGTLCSGSVVDAKVVYQSTVGNDSFGEFLRARLAACPGVEDAVTVHPQVCVEVHYFPCLM